MYINSDQTIVVQQQTQTHERRVQDSIDEVLTQIKERSEDDSLASTIAQIKVVLNSSAIWMKFLRNRILQLQNNQAAHKASKDRKHNYHTNTHKMY